MRIGGEVIEACIASARALRGLRIDLVQIRDDRPDRRAEAVEIEPVETDLALRMLVVPFTEPAHERQHLGVAPHPRREPLEAGQRGVGVAVVAFAAHEAVDAIRIGPVRFDRDRGQAVMLNEVFRDARAKVIEVLRAVRRFTDRDRARPT